MELKKLYRDTLVLCQSEIPLNDFLLFCDMAARTFLSKYPKRLLLPKGQYSTPRSLDASLMISTEFYTAVLYFAMGSFLHDEKYLKMSESAANDAYIRLWRENARGKRRKGDEW